MSGIVNYYNNLRSYEFLDYHKAVVANQTKIHNTPNPSSFNKLLNVCWYNTASIGIVGLDVVTHLAVSSLRPIGLCLPLPPAPPEFPTPHTNVEFLNYALFLGESLKVSLNFLKDFFKLYL